MDIENDAYVKKLVDKIGENFQKLENYLQRKYPGEKYLKTKVEIRFPRGYFRKCEDFRKRYPCNDQTIGRNVSYAIFSTDLIRWLLNRFKLLGTLRSMVIKLGVVIVTSAIEGIIHDTLRVLGIKPAKSLKKNIEKLRQEGVISERLAKELQKFRKKRDNIHLYVVREWEYQKYTLADYNRGIILLKYLNEELQGK